MGICQVAVLSWASGLPAARAIWLGFGRTADAWDSGVGALEEVVEAADAEPAVAVGFEEDAVTAAFLGAAVLIGEQVDERAVIVVGSGEREADLLRIGGEVVDADDGVVAPLIAHDHDQGKLCGGAGMEECEVAPADLGNLLAHADNALHPVEEGVGIAALRGDIDVREAIGSFADDGEDGLVALGEAALRFGGPLHGSTRAVAFGEV